MKLKEMARQLDDIIRLNAFIEHMDISRLTPDEREIMLVAMQRQALQMAHNKAERIKAAGGLIDEYQ